MRLIDADALVAELKWLQSQVSSTSAIEIQEYIDRINAQPTVDAVVLPCKLGDKAFWPCPLANKVLPFTVDSFIIQDGELFVMGTHGEGEFPWKECCLTRAEAEAALAKMKGGASDGLWNCP